MNTKFQTIQLNKASAELKEDLSYNTWYNSRIWVVANWKLNFTLAEVEDWLRRFNENLKEADFKKVEPVVCPGFLYIEKVRENLPCFVKVGTQDISPFGEGAYTGEVGAFQVEDFVAYSIIGHSERRQNFFEDDKMIKSKVLLALEHNITPIVCISEISQLDLLRDLNVIFAYEPLGAIGTGNPESPMKVNEIAQQVKHKSNAIGVLYGGSVTKENIESFVGLDNIDGVLVGKESLDASEFFNMCEVCDTLI